MQKSTIRRVITHHNQHGKSAVLLDELSDLRPGFASEARVLWQTHEYPANVNGDDDAADESSGMHAAGSLIRVVDFPPRSEGANHRTQSLDYAIVVTGELEMALDDGSKTVVKPGDIIVQRATMHQWNNRTDSIARVVFVLLPSSPVVVNGVELLEEGVPKKFQTPRHR